MANMASASAEDICNFIKRKYKLPKSAVENASQVLEGYFQRRKNFELVIERKLKKVVVIAEKTPEATPEVN